MIKYSKDTDNIVTLTLDMKGKHINVINPEKATVFSPVIQYLQGEKNKRTLKGIVITSAKKNFLVDGNLEYLDSIKDASVIYQLVEALRLMYREIEKPEVPIVAAINGTALGNGFQLALACHHRIALDYSKIKLGYPEVNIGLMPNGGGCIRLMWLLGLEKAFEVLASGQLYTPRAAMKIGMIDDLAKDHKELMFKAKKWILDYHKSGFVRPWDQPNATIKGGTARDTKLTPTIQRLTAELFKQNNNNRPAPLAILNTLVEGSLVDFDTAGRIESRYFTQLACGQTSKNMIKAFWFDYNQIKEGHRRPKGFGRFRPRKVGIVGAGRMGSGIALICLLKNMEVVLKDVSKSVALKGRQTILDGLEASVEAGEIDKGDVAGLINKLVTTDKTADFAECDLVIEAVFENYNLKSKVIREAEEHMDEYAFLASNTISIPITKLAKSSSRPDNFIGLHFFAPISDIPLVEIAHGEKTSDETLARAFDFVRSIGKIPIVVKDNWGFYVARTQNTYILEGITMLQEGYAPGLIENLGRQIGMPIGALALADDLSLDIVAQYEKQAAEHYGSKYVQHPAVKVCKIMIDELSRKGGRTKEGFYDGETGAIWKELTEHFPTTKTNFDRVELTERLLFAQVLETAWCLQEEIVTTIAEANLGSILGWGFPRSKGGALQYIDDYGLKAFVAKAKVYEKQFGQRFSVPPLLQKIAKKQDRLVDAFV